LVSKIEWAARHPEELARMGREARAEYLLKYTAERNYQLMMELYHRVRPLGHRHSSVDTIHA
jgi:hypothetical protein